MTTTMSTGGLTPVSNRSTPTRMSSAQRGASATSPLHPGKLHPQPRQGQPPAHALPVSDDAVLSRQGTLEALALGHCLDPCGLRGLERALRLGNPGLAANQLGIA